MKVPPARGKQRSVHSGFKVEPTPISLVISREGVCSLLLHGRQGFIMLPNWDDQRILYEGFSFPCRKSVWITSSVTSQSLETPGVEENQEIVLCANKEHLIAMKVTIL